MCVSDFGRLPSTRVAEHYRTARERNRAVLELELPGGAALARLLGRLAERLRQRPLAEVRHGPRAARGRADQALRGLQFGGVELLLRLRG